MEALLIFPDKGTMSELVIGSDRVKDVGETTLGDQLE